MKIKINSKNTIIPENYHYDMQAEILKGMLDCHEKVLIEVLSQLLKRDPILEDAKRLTRYIYDGCPDSYDLAFDGVKIGKVVTSGNKDYNITFEPVEMFK